METRHFSRLLADAFSTAAHARAPVEADSVWVTCAGQRFSPLVLGQGAALGPLLVGAAAAAWEDVGLGRTAPFPYRLVDDSEHALGISIDGPLLEADPLTIQMAVLLTLSTTESLVNGFPITQIHQGWALDATDLVNAISPEHVSLESADFVEAPL